MRLQQALHVDKPVASIKIRFTSTDVPTSAAVLVTDIQLQPGEQPTGVSPNPREAGTSPGRAQYRNGVIHRKLKLIALSNADVASPVKMSVRNASGQTRIGSFNFGVLDGDATADGVNHTATHGYGQVPIVTARQDLNLRADVTGRVHLRLAWNERER